MRTSRVANETYKIANITSPSKSAVATSKSHASAFSRTLGKYVNGDSTSTRTAVQGEIKQEEESESDSELSSVISSFDEDIEDAAAASEVGRLTSRKRKRGTETTSITSATSREPTASKTLAKTTAASIEVDASKKLKKAKRQPAKKTITAEGDVEIHAPARWREVYDVVKEMRAKTQAPVDTMGCETLADEKVSPRVRYQHRTNFTGGYSAT